MPKVTLDRQAFKALASETRLDILKALDGKQLNLTDLSNNTNLNKATLHEHLKKLTDTGLVKKKQRPGHKWVYYKLSWKGESLLHPENTKIVVMFTIAFLALFTAITQMVLWAQGNIVTPSNSKKLGAMDTTNILNGNESELPPLINETALPENGTIILNKGGENIYAIYQNPIFLYAAVICFTLFIVILGFAIYKLWKDKTPKL